MVHDNFTSFLDSVSGVVSVGAWVREVFVSNFGMGCVGRVGPQKFGVKKNMIKT